MEGSVRILKNFIVATMLISIFLLVLNFILLGFYFFNGKNVGISPERIVQQVAANLEQTSDMYSLASTTAQLLNDHHAWAMLINQDGNRIWSYNIPEELPEHYTVKDVVKFSKWYLMDYPVFVWEHEEGFVVVGYPKETFTKYNFTFPIDWATSIPRKLMFLFLFNISLVLFLSLLIGFSLIRSIRPLTKGIQALGEDQEVYIEPKGVLADLAENINRVSRLLRKKNISLKERDEARSNWIAGISHDIRTPLSMILGYSSDLEENQELPIEQRKQASVIRRQAENLRSLVNDLNLVSLLEYEMQPLNKRQIRLPALIRQVVTDFLNSGLDEQFTIDVGLLDERAIIEGDERLLTRALTNLIQNSIRHNPEGCTIYIRTTYHEDNEMWHVVVEDNGKGVSSETIPYLLELPYTTKRKRTSANGHGLGLPMVARIAKAHDGYLHISSEEGKGLKAELGLPAIEIE